MQLAKDSVEAFVLKKKRLPAPSLSVPGLADKAGVFVSIKKRGKLRGCIGTFLPSTDSLASEVVQNAVSAATQDPRFAPVLPDELDELQYTVDILSAPEKVAGPEALDPGRYGIIVSSGSRRGLLLPDLEGVDSVDEQIRIARMKAGISQGEDIELFRFEVKRYR